MAEIQGLRNHGVLGRCMGQTVANTLGEKMVELGLEGNSGSMTVDLQKLPAGVYFFIVTDQNGRTSSGKVVKQ